MHLKVNPNCKKLTDDNNNQCNNIASKDHKNKTKQLLDITLESCPSKSL